MQAISLRLATAILSVGIFVLSYVPGLAATDAPSWMHTLVSAPLPSHDEKTDAVLLYSETNIIVSSQDQIKTTVREAYKIIRPEGRHRGTVIVYINSNKKVTALHGWCIPAKGKDYEIKDKDALEVSPLKMDGGELVSDIKIRILRIPAPDPGNIIGYEYVVEEHPLVLQDSWNFQEIDPVRESHYSLQLPIGWEFKTSWIDHAEIIPTHTGDGQWQWSVSDLKGVEREEDMPPLRSLLGRMVVSFFPPGPPRLNHFSNWDQMGSWYVNLTSGRRDASPEIKQEVVALTAFSTIQLDKMKAVAQFVQQDIRYVAIELGIGGWQPHSASEVFAHRYGDCKDKATLMSAMLQEIGVDSYYVIINSRRGSVDTKTPAETGSFNHAVLAIKLPEVLKDPSLIATMDHPKYGRILFFDPTNELVPFGQIGGYLQSNYGLMVTPAGGELVELPRLPSSTNGIQRTAKLTLDSDGKLQGDVREVRVGDRARSERHAIRSAPKDSDRIRPFETLLASSLSNFRITKASMVNLRETAQPFGLNYSFEAEDYGKSAGSLLLVRPRVIGDKSSGILETKDPRQFPIEFEGPARDTDDFEITLPPGYEVDELPPPVDADFTFASYHSKTEVKGNMMSYTRTFEVKQLTVPVSDAGDLKKFYRIIASDERNTAVLRPSK